MSMWLRACSVALIAAAAAAADDTKKAPPAPGGDKLVDQVTLQDGRVVNAPILKESADKLWLDMGFTVLEVPRAQIESIVRAKPDAQVVDASKSDLFQVARNLRIGLRSEENTPE